MGARFCRLHQSLLQARSMQEALCVPPRREGRVCSSVGMAASWLERELLECHRLNLLHETAPAKRFCLLP